MEQYCQQPMTQSNCSGENVNKWKSPSTGNMSMEYNSSGGFDCNICLDLVQDPVVTLCGHLYCWPCIYRWMHSQRSSVENSGQRPECPVCKAEVSQNTLIPLYGRGQPRKLADNRGTELVDVIPQRPDSPGCRVNNLITSTTSSTSQHLGEQFHYRSHHPFHYQVHPYNFLDANFQSPAPSLAGTTTYISMIEMFSKMIQAGINGNSHFTDYNHANTYSVVTTSSVRGRMHMMHVDRSLSRVVFFLWCCAILCWLLF